jgi:GTP-binding protein
VVKIGERDFVIADIPGLIEGASEGAGLGDRFLGHVERCKVLVHLVDGTEEDVKGAYKTIRNELKAYSQALAEKPEIVVLNKADALTPAEIKTKSAALKRASKAEVLVASGVSRQGIDAVLYRIIAVLDGEKAEQREAERRAAEPHWAP